MTMRLSSKQEIFCQRYLELGNASNAYREAYDAIQMKPTTVNHKAKELLDNGKITARLVELQERQLGKHDINMDTIVQDMACIAFFDPISLYHPDGKPKQLHEIDPQARKALGITMKDGELVVSLSAKEKLVAQEKLGIYLKTGGFAHNLTPMLPEPPSEEKEINYVDLARRTVFLLFMADQQAKQEGVELGYGNDK